MYRLLGFMSVGVTVILIVSVAIGCGSNRKNIEELAGEGNELRVYEVFGMDCPGCHGGVEKLVNRLNGVIASKANWEKQQLTVVILRTAEITDQMIFDAIKQANFTPGKRLR
ncbi:MAG: cation transporter [Candidatus Zixiibacteriota bacterium]|nr:MAG: cation transporter [candidate division Zixibacteria bacterium]